MGFLGETNGVIFTSYIDFVVVRIGESREGKLELKQIFDWTAVGQEVVCINLADCCVVVKWNAVLLWQRVLNIKCVIVTRPRLQGHGKCTELSHRRSEPPCFAN